MVFAEHLENAIFGLGKDFTLQRDDDSNVLGHGLGAEVHAAARQTAIGAIEGRHFKGDFSLYAPHYTPKVPEQKVVLEKIAFRSATESAFVKRSVGLEDGTTAKHWCFAIRVETGLGGPFYFTVGFMQRDQLHQQAHNNVVFYQQNV